jgi:hypothetical protein
MAQRKVTSRQWKLLWRNTSFFGATLVDFAPTKPSMAQCKVPWRNVTFFGAKSTSMAQRKMTSRQRNFLRLWAGLYGATPGNLAPWNVAWRDVARHRAKEVSLAPRRGTLAQGGLTGGDVLLLGATSPSLAQGEPACHVSRCKRLRYCPGVPTSRKSGPSNGPRRGGGQPTRLRASRERVGRDGQGRPFPFFPRWEAPLRGAGT